MRRHNAAVFCLAALIAVFASVAQAEDDPVVARRGADQMTLSQLRAMLAGASAEARAQIAANPSLAGDVARDYLVQRALLREAQDENWASKPEIILLLKQVHDRAVMDSFLSAKAQPPADYPSAADITAFYDGQKQNFMVGRLYHLSHVFIAASGAGQAAAKTKLAGLKGDIARGRKNFSHPGAGFTYEDIGWPAEAAIIEPVRGLIKGLPENTVSDPVCTAAGCHLFVLLATRPAGPAPLAEIKPRLIEAMRQAEAKKLAQVYENSLLQKQPIQINEIALDRVARP
jgi:peptidylprolyl isomerase